MSSSRANMKDSSEVQEDNEKSACEVREVRREWRRLLCELLLDFARNSTLHGVRYLTARGLSALERIFWGIIFLTSVGLCVMGTTKVWIKWQTSPIIISVNEQLTSVMEVPFPAVTICPMTKVNQKYYNFTKHYIALRKFLKELNNENATREEKFNKAEVFVNQTPHMRELISIYNLVCYTSDTDITTYIRDYLYHNSVLHMMMAAPSFDDIYLYGEWLQTYMGSGASRYYTPVLMEDGICFTSNTLAANEMLHLHRLHTNYSYLNASTPRRGWSPESQYYNSSTDTYPWRGRSNSVFITLILHEKKNRGICRSVFLGYQVYLHHPADLPQSSSNFYAVQSDERALFSVKVNLVSTSDTLINYAPHIRQCYFPSERELNFFKVYTQSNCRLECLTNYTLARCGCVDFHMPRNHSTLMCVSRRDASCVGVVSDKYSTADDEFSNNCECLPLCHNVQYEADIVRIKINDDEEHSKTLLLVENEINNESKSNLKSTAMFTRIDMHFKDVQFTSLRRSELFSANDFLANCGGLLGLFLGFSFISLVELFFFATLRLACLFTRHERADKKGDADCNTLKLSKF